MPIHTNAGRSHMIRLLLARDAEHTARSAAALIHDLIATRHRDAGVVHLALAGGTTPRRMYELLAERRSDWSGVHLWFGDERVVDLDTPDANARLVRDALATPAGIPPSHVHVIRTELGAAAACDAYARELADQLPPGIEGMPVLDVAVLGVGEDGHTASLFPRSPALGANARICTVVDHAPKPPPVRITMTMAMLNAARCRIVLATGAGKATAVARAMGEPDPDVPASLLRRDDTTWALDAAAAAALDHGTPHA